MPISAMGRARSHTWAIRSSSWACFAAALVQAGHNGGGNVALDGLPVEVKGARTSIRALSWPFAPLPVIMGRGPFSCVPRAVPGPVARGLVPAL